MNPFGAEDEDNCVELYCGSVAAWNVTFMANSMNLRTGSRHQPPLGSMLSHGINRFICCCCLRRIHLQTIFYASFDIIQSSLSAR